MASARSISAMGITNRWERLLWGDVDTLPHWQRRLRRPARLARAIGLDFSSGLLSLQAMGLVYTTLLSLVPLLAVSFSVLKGFGVHNQIEPMLLQALSPLGAGAQEVAQQLIGYVDRTNVGVLGAVGLAVLLYSVLSLISKIEQVFNMIWRISHPRPLSERFSRYLSVLLVGPVLLFSGVAASASLRSNTLVQRVAHIEPFGFLLHIGEQVLPFSLITLAFAFVYSFVPNTRVRLIPALVGAATGALLWLTAGDLFAQFMAGSTRYAAIYSGLAILILFMIWVYIAWLIVLIGANIAFYWQYPEYLAAPNRELRLSNRLRERVALQLMRRIVERHFSGSEGVTEEELARSIRMPPANVRILIDTLRDGRFLERTASEPSRLVPAQAPEQVRVTDFLRYVRRFEERSSGLPDIPEDSPIARIEQRLQQGMDEALGDMTLKDLAMQDDEPGITRSARAPA